MSREITIKVPLKFPLPKFVYGARERLKPELEAVIAAELNVKEVVWDPKMPIAQVAFQDTVMTLEEFGVLYLEYQGRLL
jgi:hypothetical protein